MNNLSGQRVPRAWLSRALGDGIERLTRQRQPGNGHVRSLDHWKMPVSCKTGSRGLQKPVQEPAGALLQNAPEGCVAQRVSGLSANLPSWFLVFGVKDKSLEESLACVLRTKVEMGCWKLSSAAWV